MFRVRIAGVLSLLLAGCFAQGQTASTTGTYVAGNCKPSLPSFSSIMAALNASPAPTTVQVCPGTYYEQVEITQPVTLQGITSGGAGVAVIAVPGGDLALQVMDADGQVVFPQLWVNNVAGTVNVTDLTVDGTGSKKFVLTGIFFQNSPGTVNHVSVRNQTAAYGDGVIVEGGVASPAVTVENSAIHDFASIGIILTTAPGLTATIKGNDIDATGFTSIFGGFSILAEAGNVSISNNYVTGGNTGVDFENGVTGSATGNVIMKAGDGVIDSADGVSVTGNKIFDSTFIGIAVGTAAGTIKSNSIMHAQTGIDFGCVANTNTSSNTITNAAVGVNDVPGGVTVSNTYYSVGTVRSSGACPLAR